MVVAKKVEGTGGRGVWHCSIHGCYYGYLLLLLLLLCIGTRGKLFLSCRKISLSLLQGSQHASCFLVCLRSLNSYRQMDIQRPTRSAPPAVHKKKRPKHRRSRHGDAASYIVYTHSHARRYSLEFISIHTILSRRRHARGNKGQESQLTSR